LNFADVICVGVIGKLVRFAILRHAAAGSDVHPSIGGADHDPFHLPRAGAASCCRSNLGPAIGCSGARFVNPGSP